MWRETVKGVILISGGVDSAVAAYLLKQNGDQVIGLFLAMLGEKGKSDATHETHITEEITALKAEKVCSELKLDDFIVLDLEKEFRETVIKNFAESYQAAVTPNPCVLCNRLFKFGKAVNFAKNLNADYISTGHYTKVEFSDFYKKTLLKRGTDNSKDQSYFLSYICDDTLPFIKFPLGDYYKKDVRRIAEQLCLSSSQHADSQEICFVPNNQYTERLRDEGITVQPGVVLDINGKAIGKHSGYQNYTIGQRTGMEFYKALTGRLFVYRINGKDNTLTVAPYDTLLSHDMRIRNVNFYTANIPAECFCQIRKKAKTELVRIYIEDYTRVHVHFVTPVFAITPGQFAVFYDQEGYVLGSGEIETPLP
jgi:tRNA-specific 2-thiouridylase